MDDTLGYSVGHLCKWAHVVSGGHLQAQQPVATAGKGRRPGESPEGRADEDGSGERTTEEQCCGMLQAPR